MKLNLVKHCTYCNMMISSQLKGIMWDSALLVSIPTQERAVLIVTQRTYTHLPSLNISLGFPPKYPHSIQTGYGGQDSQVSQALCLSVPHLLSLTSAPSPHNLPMSQNVFGFVQTFEDWIKNMRVHSYNSIAKK